ncbi:hypothetical protein PUNSTDRAFT_53547 [Punctularia strigosozonata HHB-11173 SS5]|uniref:uncharacterized protein n=1 Tax=Punctularia strigosozonata (strain HHB-11173) TaxID=741275 RepID=UPI0004417000|nr:uncharacterized protein PUNSTDRAFT_53547 [Punctularia strigosozonata HHB-11173 SS5]EIN07167.1 hypothetical protein PUNSTDRAFT_53547 [Punctularia strigosozonata HHB-11173 SS5]
MGDASIANDQRQIGDGQMVNEEGLPIVDISEPVSEDTFLTPVPRVTNTTDRLQSSVTLTEEPPLVPLSSLPAVEHERLRDQRSRILDILEEEEREHEANEEARQEQKRKEALERRKKEASDELDKLRAQRELQKKMGKALLKNMADAREREEKMRRQQEADDAQTLRDKEKVNALKPRKSVSFAALPKGTTGDHDIPIDSASKKKTSATPTMKIDVVERFPGKISSGPGTPVPKSAFDRIPDSDDESELESPVAHGTARNQDHLAEEDSDESGRHVPHSSSDDDGGMESDGDMEEFDPDFDRIQHQREIALAYYEKRNAIGVDAHSAMTSHKHEADEGLGSEHPWDQPEVPLDATLAGPPPKPAVSRFRADRHPEMAAQPSTFISTSLGASILPESEGSMLQNAIHRGKLVDDDLVAYDSEDEDDDPAVRELLNALVRGEVQNTGPGPQGPQVKADNKRSAEPAQKASRFKATQDPSVSRTARSPNNMPITAAYTTEPNNSISTNVSERRAPQVRSSPSASTTPRKEASFSPKTTPAPPKATPRLARTSVNGSSSGFTSMVLESPSFQPPAPHSSPSQSLRQAESAPTTGEMPGNIVISPSYPPTNRPQRPPTVMSAAVLERTVSATKASADEEPKREKKVSRFRMERV